MDAYAATAQADRFSTDTVSNENTSRGVDRRTAHRGSCIALHRSRELLREIHIAWLGSITTGALHQLPPAAGSGKEHRHLPPVRQVFVAELLDQPFFLAARQQNVDQHDDRKQSDRKQRWPVDHAFAEQSDEQTRVLGMPYQAVKTTTGAGRRRLRRFSGVL